jgi:hypothetical protein
MSGKWPWSWQHSDFPSADFPNLVFGKNGNHVRTSWNTHRYNCIAWAAGECNQPWWPQSYDAYWPPYPAIDEATLLGFVSAFRTRGYEVCKDGSLEQGFEKVAIYMRPNDPEPTHAARQLSNGKWTSKLGDFADITHDTPDDVNGFNRDSYGTPQCYLRRRRPRLHLRVVRALQNSVRSAYYSIGVIADAFRR